MVLPLPIQSPQTAAMMGPPPPMASPLALIGDPMGAPPMMDAMGGMDPLSLLADPAVLMRLLDLMAEEQEMQEGPVYDRWYRPADYPKPKIGDVIAKVRADHELHQLLIRRIRADRQLLRLLDVGKFRDADDIEVTFQDSSLVHDVALVINLLAGCDHNYEARARTVGDAELAEKKEQFAHAFRARAERRHRMLYGTSLAYDEAKFAVETGHLLYRFGLDFDAESDEVPILLDVLDPTRYYPTWDEHGIVTMSGYYSEPIARILSRWDRDGKKKAKRDLLNTKVNDPAQHGAERYRTLDDTVEVMEYWDRRHYVVVAAGVEIVNTEHRFGHVPFTYFVGPFGDAGPASLESLNGSVGLPTSGMAQQQIAARGLSHIWASKTTHSQREAILGRMMTELKKSGNPDRTFEQSPNVYGSTPKVSNAEGSISLLRMGDERELPPVQKPGLSLAAPILGIANEAVQRGLMPPSSYGLTSNANQSGTAMEGMNESGHDKVTPWLMMLQDAAAANAEEAMRLTRDWGYLLGSDGERGTFYIERRKPDQQGENTIMLTPAELRQVGIRIRCKLTSLRLSNLGNLGNALAVWKNQGWLEDVEALEMRGVQDPVATLRRIEIQEMKKDPAYRQIAILKMLEEEGDFRGAMLYRQMMQSQGAGAPPGAPQQVGPSGPPQGGPGAPAGVPQGPNGASRPPGALGMPSQMAGPQGGPTPAAMMGGAGVPPGSL